MKIVKNLPEPPAITSKIKEKILREGKKNREGITEKACDLTRLTWEDWRVKIR